MQVEKLTYDEYIDKGNTGRHETFTPRYGWIKKGYEAIVNDPNAFRAPDAIERLGVGKNMVRSIQFWCKAFKLMENDKTNLSRMSLSKLGKKLLDNRGWDPYVEDVATLWLLHWQLFVPQLEAVNWNLAFNKCNLWSFDIKQLGSLLFNISQRYKRLSGLSYNSYERDASCIIRMYVDEEGKDTEIECPFTQLGLLYRTEELNSVAFNMNEKTTLPELIFAAACFSYLASYAPGQKTISLQRLAYEFNSPGVAFKISETTVGSYLNHIDQKLKGVALVDSIGTLQLHLERDAEELYWEALEKYYAE